MRTPKRELFLLPIINEGDNAGCWRGKMHDARPDPNFPSSIIKLEDRSVL